jgi:hypothetical protein
VDEAPVGPGVTCGADPVGVFFVDDHAVDPASGNGRWLAGIGHDRRLP